MNERIRRIYDGQTALVTGTSGFYMSHLTECIIQETSMNVKATARTEEAARKMMERFRWAKPGRFEVVYGDITQPKVIMALKDGKLVEDTKARQNITDTINVIYHGAGDVRFMAPLEQLIAANVDGKKNMLALAKDCRNLVAYHDVSTAYVNPIGKGKMMEDELREDRSLEGCGGSYEFSKLQGEKIVRAAMREEILDCPITLYRPSIIVGHSNNRQSGGKDMTFNSYVYGLVAALRITALRGNKKKLLEAWESGLYNGEKIDIRMKGHLKTLKSFICVDQCAERMFWLSTRENPKNATYHVVGEPINGVQVGQTIERALPFLKINYVGENIESPTEIETKVDELTAPFKYYTLNSDEFDTTNSERVLQEVGFRITPMTSERFAAVICRFVENEIIVPIRRPSIKQEDY